jgi:queuine tRNA-ribosyltransferase
MFHLSEKRGERRLGRLSTPSGASPTPFFMPIATKGAIKHILPTEARSLGATVLLGNTYHLSLRPGEELIEQAGGLHRFMDWDGPILTDSGGFQVFSLGARAASRFGTSGVTLSEEGVAFTDPQNGDRHFMTPENSIDIQLALGSDIIMVLDECPPYPATREYALLSLARTTRWAARAFAHFHTRLKERSGNGERPLLFAIVQGSVYEDLRRASAEALVNLEFAALGGPETGFDGYAIGGVAVGEPRETLPEILAATLPHLPEDRPRYLMGLGRPEEIVTAVCQGVDMFDCVIPTREGRHGRLFCSTGAPLSPTGAFYKAINIQNEKFREDFTPVDPACDCPLCTRYTKSYLRHLFSVGEPLGARLASLHNLRFYLSLMERLRRPEL